MATTTAVMIETMLIHLLDFCLQLKLKLTVHVHTVPCMVMGEAATIQLSKLRYEEDAGYEPTHFANILALDSLRAYELSHSSHAQK